MMGPRTPGAWGWRMTTRGVISSWLTFNLYKICCCNGMHANLWGLIKFITRYWRSWSMLLQDFSLSYRWSWESGEVPLDWKLANVTLIFKMSKKTTLVIIGLSVSLQFLVKLWRRLFFELLKNISETMLQSSKSTWVHGVQAVPY